MSRKRPAKQPRSYIIPFRVSPAFRDWLKALAREEDASVSEILERALGHRAIAIRFKRPPKRRVRA